MAPCPSGELGLHLDRHPGEGALIDFLARSVRAALGAALVLALTAPGASAATFLVDDDKAECPNAGYTSVEDTIADANMNGPGADTVIVCEGVYAQTGEIPVTGPLTLRGAGAGLVRIEASSPFSAYLLRATGSGPVDVSGVTLAGAPPTIDGAIRWEGTGGTLSASRITNLGSGSVGVFGEGGTGADYTVAGSLVEGYGTAGLLFEGGTAGTLGVTVSNSVIRGAGPQNTAPQDGILVSRGSATTATGNVFGNVISDNRYTPDEAQAAGVRFRNVSAGTFLNDNDIQGNGYGVFNGDGSDCDTSATPVAANANWWGDVDGPSLQPRLGCPAAPLAVTGSPSQGDRISANVNHAFDRVAPRGAPLVPAQPVDAPPAITGLSPADGTEAEPGSQVTVTAAASDDFDIKSVQFRRGATVVKTDVQPPYDAPIDVPPAGQSTSVLVTAVDSSGQTDSEAISLRGKAAAPAPAPDPVTPQQPAEPEDRPPSVAITGPGEGTAISPSAPPRISADAADDRGVARVAFLDDGKVICTDDVAPYDCAYAPTGDDVGRDTLIAIAVDGAGQTAVAFRGVTVQRFDPKLTARTTPRRDRKRPYRYTTTGSLLLPAGVTPEQACTTGGSVSIEFRVGKLRLPQTAPLRPDCSFRTSIAFPSRRSLGNGRIAVSAKFGGNVVLGTAKAPSQKVRAG